MTKMMLLEVPPEMERRSQSGEAFGGVAEITTIDPHAFIVAPTAKLCRFGCFVRTSTSLPVGTTVSVRITHEGHEFNAAGEVITSSEKGVGIKFKMTDFIDEPQLQSCLMQIIA